MWNWGDSLGTYEQVIKHHKQKRVNNLKRAVARADGFPEPLTDEKLVNRRLAKEANANWKVVCECGETRYYKAMNIGELDEQVKSSFHPKHMKAIFFKDGGQRQFRGSVPAVE